MELPSASQACEKGVTREWCFSLPIPADAKAGTYKGSWAFQHGEGKRVSIPVEITVHPFALEEVLPLSLGMYYGPRHEPGRDDETNLRLTKEQVRFMRRLGMTGLAIGAPYGVCARLGSVAATYALEHLGGTSHAYTWDEFKRRYEVHFGAL